MTSTEVQPWEEPAVPVVHLASAPSGPAPATSDIDSWVQLASAYTRLANQIANTDFPPAEMRGKPEALVATFLMGREMNLGPMTALMNLHVIKGKVGQSAHLMRAMILARGHEIEYDEATDSQCVCRGRRRGEQSWTYVTFTAQQARTAGIDLGKYPADKLVARATARVARRKFADVIAGMEYTSEELDAGDYVFGDDAQAAALEAGAPTVAEEAPKATRTTRRPATRGRGGPPPATATTPPAAPQNPPAAAPPAAAPTQRPTAPRASTPGPSGPPLPGEEEPPTGEPDPAPAQDKPAPPEAKMVTKNQLGKIGALFTEAKVTDRAARLRVCASMADRNISSSTELTSDEASSLIDHLQELGPDGVAALADPGNAAAPAAEGEQGQLGDQEPVDAEVVEEQQGGES